MPVLTLTSYVFYGWTNPWFVLLILWSTLVDFCCGNLIYGHWSLIGPLRHDADGEPVASDAQRKIFLAVSLLSNIGMLCFFKYFMFAAANLNHMLAMFGKREMEILVVLLPAGISFYTFESISYNLDIYHGRARPASVWVLHSPCREWASTVQILDAAQDGIAGSQRVCLLHHSVSPSRRRADHPLSRPRAATS